MYLRALTEDNSDCPAKGSKFGNYLINNNPIRVDRRDYELEVEGIPCSFEGHPQHKEWKDFLKDNPHLISNFDTRDHGKLSFLFDRWKLMKDNAEVNKY